MARIIYKTNQAPAAVGPYSQAIEAGGFIFCSGQIAIDPSTNVVLQGSIEEQTHQIMKNITAVLTAADCKLSDVVKTTIFLTSMNDFAKVNEVYGSYFTKEPPARSTVAVSGLPKGVQVEIEVVASRS